MQAVNADIRRIFLQSSREGFGVHYVCKFRLAIGLYRGIILFPIDIVPTDAPALMRQTRNDYDSEIIL